MITGHVRAETFNMFLLSVDVAYNQSTNVFGVEIPSLYSPRIII
jgi:hypothetical protein